MFKNAFYRLAFTSQFAKNFLAHEIALTQSMHIEPLEKI